MWAGFHSLPGSGRLSAPTQASLEGLGTAEMQGRICMWSWSWALAQCLGPGAGQTWGQGAPSIRDEARLLGCSLRI